MQYNQILSLTPQLLNALIGDNTQLFQNELDKYQSEISALLSSYHWNEKGVVHALKVDENSIMIDEEGKGRFRVNYTINIHYGCSDIDIDLDKIMTITIKTDLENKTATLTGEYIPDREPDRF